ncbi:hypothetical protein WJX72_000764 [[Myrmecia] bisecta]|uniref:Expansin-like EG45 domain-containing protein n=1 Tax=[Myrmecia] bisecta TaxID=41462 RepID=A0AAW1Q6F4_9CHLO
MGHSSALLAAGACLVLALLPHTSAQPPTFGSSYTGDGTYYGIQPYPGSDQGSGHCSMQFANSYPLSWTTGVQNGVAMNHAQYAGACGLCVAFRGTGKGLGTAPIPLDWQYAIVTGDLDLAAVGDGRWIIEWHPVLCNVGNGVFQYSFQGSNAYYIKLQITNSRVPITKVQMQGALGLQDMAPTVDNYWLADGGPFTFPAQVIVTSMLDDTVNDIITTGPADTSTGAAQAQPTVVATPAATSRSTDQSEAAEFPSRTTPITAPCSQAFNENDQCGTR